MSSISRLSFLRSIGIATAVIALPKLIPSASPVGRTRSLAPFKTYDAYVDASVVTEGGNAIILTRPDGATDIFFIKERQDARTYAKAEPRSADTAAENSSTYCTIYDEMDVTLVTGDKQVEVEGLSISFSIPRFDCNVSYPHNRIDQIVFEPPKVCASWREVVWV